MKQKRMKFLLAVVYCCHYLHGPLRRQLQSPQIKPAPKMATTMNCGRIMGTPV